MSSYSYVAIDNGKPVTGRIEASNPEAVKSALTARGLFVTSVKEDKSFFQRDFSFSKHLPLTEQAWFARQLSILVDAGAELPAALGLLARQKKGKAVGQLAETMRTEVLAGRSPSAVAAAHEEELGALFVAMVAAGEESGVLPTTLDQLANLLETKAALRKKTRAALTYPLTTILATAAIATVILLVIVPIFGKMFAQFGAKLPAPTLLLVNSSHFFVHHWYALPAIVVIIGLLVWWGSRQEQIAYAVSAASFRAPIIGSLLSKSALARVSSTISTMMASGTKAEVVLSYAAQATSNRVWMATLTRVSELLKGGRSFSAAIFQAAQETPGTDTNFEVLGQMVEVGERSGATPKVLGHLSKRLTEEVESGMAMLESSLEPLLICIVGGVVGGMMVALYMPIFHIITVIGNQASSSA